MTKNLILAISFGFKLKSNLKYKYLQVPILLNLIGSERGFPTTRE